MGNTSAASKLPPSIDPSRNKFAIGIKLKELSIRTCDKEFNDVEKANPKAGELTYKKITVDGLSIFVDWMDNMHDYVKSEEEREQLMKQWELFQAKSTNRGSKKAKNLAQLRGSKIDLSDNFDKILDGEFDPEN